MDTALLDFVVQCLFVALEISAPPVLAALLVGFVTSLLQTTTQLQDQTLAVVPKLVAVYGVTAISIWASHEHLLEVVRQAFYLVARV